MKKNDPRTGFRLTLIIMMAAAALLYGSGCVHTLYAGVGAARLQAEQTELQNKQAGLHAEKADSNKEQVDLLVLETKSANKQPGLHAEGTKSQNEKARLQTGETEIQEAPAGLEIEGLTWSGSMPLKHAGELRVDYYGEQYSLITIHDEFCYLLVDEGAEVPENLPEDMQILQKPLDHIYASSSSCPDFFRELGTIDQVTMTSTKAEDWTIPEIREIVENEDMIYVGKYSAPDYEYICDEGCSLAIVNTMIYHAPEVSEMLMRLGIPVLTEYSSYEKEPLGRLEWIMLYGLLTDREQEARTFFDEQVTRMQEVLDSDSGRKEDDPESSSKADVVFFYIGTNGSVNVRRENDYVSRMIDMAGGRYMLRELEEALPESDSGSGSITVQMESFYAAAKDADILIYNGTLGESLEDLDALLMKSPMLEQFAAVKTGRVYCSKDNLFQEVTGTCRMVSDFCKVIRSTDGAFDEDLTYLKKLS